MPRKRVLKPPQREIVSKNGGAREGAGRPSIDLDKHAVSLVQFCRAHGWTIEAICEGLGIDDDTLKRQVDLTPRGAHGQMVALVWREMFECAMSRNPDQFHPALKAKCLVFLGERLIPEQLAEPAEPDVVTIDQISPETIIRALLNAVEKPADKKVILDAVARHREREEAESGEQS